MLYLYKPKFGGGKLSKTSAESKDKYNKSAYASYLIRVRRDSDLQEEIEKFMSVKGTSLNYLVTKLLKKHFEGAENE
jgi:hypothetical protein